MVKQIFSTLKYLLLLSSNYFEDKPNTTSLRVWSRCNHYIALHVPTSISANRGSPDSGDQSRAIAMIESEAANKSFRNYVDTDWGEKFAEDEEEIEFYRLFIMTTQWTPIAK